MANVSGNLGDLIGAPLAFPNGQPARAYLSPSLILAIEGDELRLGGLQLTLDANDVFSATNVPHGSYQLVVHHFDPANRQPTVTWIPVEVNGDTVVSA